MNLNIKITGPAGLGMNSTADIIAEIFSKKGYNIIGDIEYQSLIKGGVNWFDINISDDSTYISKNVDVILTFNDTNVLETLPFLKKGGFIISNKKWIDKISTKQEDIFNNYTVLDLEITDKYDNTYLLGMLGKLLDLDIEDIHNEIDVVFARKGEEIVQRNKAIVTDIYETYVIDSVKGSDKISLPKISHIRDAQTISYGNKMIAYGAIDSDLGYYAAYPMTPASSVLTEIIQSKKVNYLQAEDEIAVINSALGASYAGKRAMVGTSGGGFALMTEALSFAVQAEIGVTAILSQRAGPSTGTPTFTENGDLPFALNCIFGTDQHHVVLSPSSLEEAYTFGGLALNIADYYQCPVILLTDKQFSEGKVTLKEELQVTVPDKGKIEKLPSKDYKRYEYCEDNISPRTFPGIVDGDFIATSYEHDEFGATSEESETKMRMTEKRAHKLDNFFETQGLTGYELVSHSAKKMLVVTSFNTYTAKEFVKQNPDYGLVIIKFLKPLDERLIADLAGTKELTFVENSYSGQLENHLVKELQLDRIEGLKISNFRKYDLYPFYMEDYEERFN